MLHADENRDRPRDRWYHWNNRMIHRQSGLSIDVRGWTIAYQKQVDTH